MTENRSPSKRLFVGSLPYRFTEGELLSLFIPYGKVVAVKILHNRWGKSRGLGFIEFESLDSAVAAKTALHKYAINDRSIIVDYAQPDPFLTPEGQERHRLAQQNRKPPKKSSSVSGSSRFNIDQAIDTPKIYPKNFSEHQRQSVYDSRRFGARSGAKFAAKTRSKKK